MVFAVRAGFVMLSVMLNCIVFQSLGVVERTELRTEQFRVLWCFLLIAMLHPCLGCGYA